MAIDNERICTNPTCKHAGQAQPIENFNIRKDRAPGALSSWCADCHRAASRDYLRRRRRSLQQVSDLTHP